MREESHDRGELVWVKVFKVIRVWDLLRGPLSDIGGVGDERSLPLALVSWIPDRGPVPLSAAAHSGAFRVLCAMPM